ncbi:TetR/AcrR family transcriptional regulator [Streptobacillus felis]|uniref:TetR/AcrR family transcriptional regulator n=1 Tax=Streptobacillus felis TaxID=1384509 RepID=A0A7Z0PEX4_9FUSO|nr:TetR/AcrR family transcriptional regulator [Streptobacillus felis]NYV28014.1 TetR/AcrR family transcriptional regulator [Streptobacillus felis]
MPKNTFNNLPKEKKEKIIRVLKEIFTAKNIQEVNVKEIVEKLNIARGSFYQYFDNLYDAYFLILELETEDIHNVFMSIMRKNMFDIKKSLEEYGIRIADILFKKESYSIYKYRYLYWDIELEKSWNKMNKINVVESEKMHFVKAVIHDLIERMFKENWGKEKFINKYMEHLEMLKGGI